MHKRDTSAPTQTTHFLTRWKKPLLTLILALTGTRATYLYIKPKGGEEEIPPLYEYTGSYTGMIKQKNLDFTKDQRINFSSDRPTIRIIGWGKLTYQKSVNGTLETFYKEEKRGDKTTSADEIFWTDDTEHWHWKPTNGDLAISHNPGYTEAMIIYLLNKEKTPTHLILSSGWDDVLRILSKKRHSLNKTDLKKIRTIVNNRLKLNNVHIYQTLESLPQTAFQSKAHELTILILNTPEAAIAYNYLIQDKKNRVIASFHTTC